jgi:hypothetical protein
MGRSADATVVPPTSHATPAMDLGPWSIWAWLVDSAGATGPTGTASAGTTTGTQGPPSPSPIAWKGTDITVSSSRRDFEPLTPPPLPHSSNKNNSGPGSPSALSDSLESPATGPGSAQPSTHSNFLVLDTEQDDWQRQPYCRTLSSATSKTHTTNNNLNDPTNRADTGGSSPTPNSFLLCSPSKLSFVADAPLEDLSFPIPGQSRHSSKMPGTLFPAGEEPYYSTSTYTVANVAATTTQWRPHTSRSGRSARSASPLFSRWARRHHNQQPDVHAQESSDSHSSTDRKRSSSSAGNPKRALQHRDDRYHSNTDASHKHAYNFSTSTVSRSGSTSKRHSQSGLPPPLTREEFEALPVAIQRKVRLFCFRPVITS